MLNYKITLTPKKPWSFELFLHLLCDSGFLSSVWHKTVYKVNTWDLFLSGSEVQVYFLSACLYLSVGIDPYLIFSSGLALWKSSSFTVGQIARWMGELSFIFKKIIYLRRLFSCLCALKNVYGSRLWPLGRNGELAGILGFLDSYTC